VQNLISKIKIKIMEVLSIIFLTTFVEGLVQFVFSPFAKLKNYLGYIALLFGMAIAVLYQVNIPSMLGITSSIPLVDFIVSGLVIGRGSNYVNDIISTFTKKN